MYENDGQTGYEIPDSQCCFRIKYTCFGPGPNNQGKPPDGAPGQAGTTHRPTTHPAGQRPRRNAGPTLSNLDFISAACKTVLPARSTRILGSPLSLLLPKLHWPPSSQHRRGPSRLGTYIGRALRAQVNMTAPPGRPASSQEGPEGVSWVHGCTLRCSLHSSQSRWCRGPRGTGGVQASELQPRTPHH